jgi:hypothetical protein
MAKERTLPRLPPRHPVIGPIQPDPMPDQPKPPIAPSPKQKEMIEREKQQREAC